MHVRQLDHNEELHVVRDYDRRSDAATAENGIGGIVAAILHTYDTLRNLALRCRMMSSILSGENIGMRISSDRIRIGKRSACIYPQLSVPFAKRTDAAQRRQRRQRFLAPEKGFTHKSYHADASLRQLSSLMVLQVAHLAKRLTVKPRVIDLALDANVRASTGKLPAR
jgi:hypothetical protein